MSAVPAPAVPEIPTNGTALGEADRSAADLFAPGRLRALGVKSAWSLVDQGLDGAYWFLRHVSFGAMAGAGSVRSVRDCVCGVSVCGRTAQRDGARANERDWSVAACGSIAGVFPCAVGLTRGIGGYVLRGGGCIAALVWLLAPESALAGAIAGSALALPFLLSLFLARRMCYVRQRPFTATLGSGCCLVLALVGLYMLRHFERVSPFLVFVLVGAASFVGSCLVFREVGVGTFHAAGFPMSRPRGLRR